MSTMFGGIDIGSDHHHVVILQENGHILYDKRFAHKYDDFMSLIAKFRDIEQEHQKEILFAIEGKNGYGAPFDRLLIEHGFVLFNVDNLKLRRFRDVFGAEWRNDKRDAMMLAKMLRLKSHVDSKEKAFIPVRPLEETSEKLRIISRHQQTLIYEKTRLLNRLQKKLLEVCPDILEIGNISTKTMLMLLNRYPDISKLRKVKKKSLLKIKAIGEKTANYLIPKLKDLNSINSLATTYKIMIKSYCKRILELIEEIKSLDKELTDIGERNSYVKRLKSLKGVGTKLSSRLIGEIGNINRFNKESQLAVYCGIACINDDSGKTQRTRPVFKANYICKNTMVAIAGCTIRNINECKIYYEKKRSEGKKHNHALRCLARQLIKVIFKMLKEDRDYYLNTKI